MELDDFKSAWTLYDKKLSENLKFNEELLKKMNLNSSKRELQKPLVYEISGIVIGFLVIVYVFALTIRYIDEPKFCIPGFIALAVGIVYSIFSILKANRFLNIDYYGSSIVKLQKDVAELNKFILIIRKYEIILMPVLLISLLPILFKGVHNIDIYSKTRMFAIEIFLLLVISFPVIYWINKYLYDKKFKNVEKLLADLNKFEEEK